jgi:hypothetical protein
VERAAQADILQPSEGEVGAAMRAMAVDQAVAAVRVAEQYEIFPEQLDGPQRTLSLQFVQQRRRLPVHPHQLSAGVFRAGAGDQVVLFLAHHGGGSFRGRTRNVILNQITGPAMRGKWIPSPFPPPRCAYP